MADSWKTDGNCNECRRQDYCNKQCRLARERGMRLLRAKMAEAMQRVRQEHDTKYPHID